MKTLGLKRWRNKEVKDVLEVLRSLHKLNQRIEIKFGVFLVHENIK